MRPQDCVCPHGGGPASHCNIQKIRFCACKRLGSGRWGTSLPIGLTMGDQPPNQSAPWASSTYCSNLSALWVVHASTVLVRDMRSLDAPCHPGVSAALTSAWMLCSSPTLATKLSSTFLGTKSATAVSPSLSSNLSHLAIALSALVTQFVKVFVWASVKAFSWAGLGGCSTLGALGTLTGLT